MNESMDNEAGAREGRTLFTRSLGLLLRRVGKLEIQGKEHLATPGGKVIVCNHVGWLDPLWVGSAALPLKIHQMAKKELFDNPLSGWFVRSGGGFPVDRTRPAPSTLKHAISLVAQGQLLLIFPTGTRSQDDAEIRKGAAFIAARAKSVIVPAAYVGPNKVKPMDFIRRPVVQVSFGQPFSPVHEDYMGAGGTTRLLREMEQRMAMLRLSRES